MDFQNFPKLPTFSYVSYSKVVAGLQKKVLIQNCEIFGGYDGLVLDKAKNVHIKNCCIRHAWSRGIYANYHFTLEDSEVYGGRYAIKNWKRYTDLGKNIIVDEKKYDYSRL